MKKYISMMLALSIITVCLYGCGSSLESHTSTAAAESTTNAKRKPEFDLVYLWQDTYKSVEELIDATDCVFVGTVTDIMFEVKPDSTNNEPYMVTLYTIDVSEYFKGSGSGTETLMIGFGKPGYEEEAQKELAANHELHRILCYTDELTDPILCETYVFALRKHQEGYLTTANFVQIAFNVNDPRKTDRTGAICYEDFKNYYKIED